MGWKETLAFVNVHGVPHKVNGIDVDFYPLSSVMLFKLESAAKPLAEGLSALFQNVKNDHSFEDRRFGKDGGDGQEFVSHAVDEKIARLRYEQREAAIEKISRALFAPESQQLLVNIIMDSMRDVFPPEQKKAWPPAQEFLAATPGEALVEMLIGVGKANKGLLGPLALNLDSTMLKGLGQSLASRVGAFEAAEDAKTAQMAGSNSGEASPGSEADATTSTTS